MPPTDDSDSPTRERWHLDKKVPISLIFAIVVQCIMFTWFMGKQDARITVIETSRADVHVAQHDRDQRQDEDNKEAQRLLRESLVEVNGKLDRLIERGNK